MFISRRAFATLAGGVVLGVATGCNKSPEQQASDRLKWIRRIHGVEKAETVDDRIVLTVVKQLPDQDIKALVTKIQHDFSRFDDGYHSSIELVIDDHHARFYPSPTADVSQDLERALWLRKDGRSTASTYGPSGMIVTAPAASVAAVALGFDQVVPSTSGRSTHRVESADRAVVVQWVDGPELGFRLDRVAVQRFADLQRRYPGLTGWVEGPDRQAGVYFPALNLPVDALLAGLPRLATGALFGKLELGWGIARAPEAVFAKAFTPEARTVIAALTEVAGVTRLDITEGGPATVTVKDRAGYVGSLSAARGLRVELVRGPSKYVGQTGHPVFEGSTDEAGSTYRIHSAVADNLGVTEVRLGPNTGNLSIAHNITDADLASVLKAMAELGDFGLYVSQDAESLDVAALGRVTASQYAAPNPVSPKVDPALIARVTKAWANRTAR